MICLNGQRLVGMRGIVARLVTRKFEEEVYVQTCLNGQTTWNSLLPKSQRLKMEVTIYTTHCSWLLANSVLPVPTVFCLLRGFSYKERNASTKRDTRFCWTEHWVSDAIQPSHPLSSPSPPAFNLSQHQGLFKWVSSSHQVAKVLEFQLQHQSFQWIFRTDLL